ncbi:MAG: Rpn family recombination-promoting nuclease/putative transposase, partial [Cyanobacteria bacterium P01_F01_bin.86]
LIPTQTSSQRPVYFVEVQFQKDEGLYHRLFTELLFYLKQNPDTADWQAVIIYPRRKLEPQRQDLHRELLTSNRVSQIYLEDLANQPMPSLGMELVRLIVEPHERAIDKARELLSRVKQESLGQLSTIEVVDLIETIIVYKFENLGRREIEEMLGLADLKQTKVYQEALEEGREEGLQQERKAILDSLLQQMLGELDEELIIGMPALIALPNNRFLAIVVALSQPPGFWVSAIAAILQARFESIPDDLLTILNGIEETEQRRKILRRALVATSLEAFVAALNIPES